MDVRDIRWLAGLLEGEGYFTAVWRQRAGADNGVQLLIRLGMRDQDVVERAATILGVKARSYQHGKLWCCDVHSAQAAGWMMTLYGLLGTRRRQQIRLALDEWKRRPGRPARVWANA